MNLFTSYCIFTMELWLEAEVEFLEEDRRRKYLKSKEQKRQEVWTMINQMLKNNKKSFYVRFKRKVYPTKELGPRKNISFVLE